MSYFLPLRNIFETGELEKEATVRNFLTVQPEGERGTSAKFAQVQKEGEREVARNLDYYNLRKYVQKLH